MTSLRPALTPLTVRHRLVLGLLFFFLATEVFTGPVRYYLASFGLSPLVYLPKALIASAVLGSVLYTLYRTRIRLLYGAVLAVFGLFGLVGWVFTGSLLQPAFGIFSLLPLVFSVMAEPIVRQAGTRIVPYVTLLWLAAALGVVMDYFWALPWTGLTYQLGEIEIEGSREWTTFGFERLAGFARASFEAADQLLLLALPLVLLGRSRVLKLLIWTATGLLIYLTTTKKTAGSFLILTLLMPLMGATIVPALLKRTVTVATPYLVAAFGIGLPTSTFFIIYQLDLDSFWSHVLFASFNDRLTLVWPASLALALEQGSSILGRGIGGIGAAQQYFEPQSFMPADNLFIYLYVTFGLLGLAFAFFYVRNLAKLDIRHSPWNRLMWALGVAVLLNGLAANGLESPITAMLIGFSLAYSYAAARQRSGFAPKARFRALAPSRAAYRGLSHEG